MLQTLIQGLDALTLNAAVVKDALANQLAAAMQGKDDAEGRRPLDAGPDPAGAQEAQPEHGAGAVPADAAAGAP